MYLIKRDTFEKDKNAPPLGDEPLFIHSRGKGQQNSKLVLFVHGLAGDRYATWESGQDEQSRTKSFPRFIFEDEEKFLDVDIGLYAYVTGYKRLWMASIDIEDEAKVLADTLRDIQDYHQLILIGHSMGGMLIKAAINELIGRTDHSTLKRIRGVFLLVTPQIGSLWVPSCLSWFHKDMRALRPHNNLVRRITDAFLKRVVNSELDLRPGDNKLVIPCWAVVAAEDFWVDALSAGIGFTDDRRKIVRGSHTRIVKPTHRNEETYKWVVHNAFACLGLQIEDKAVEQQLKTLLNKYPLPLVAEVDPYDLLGVSRSEHVDRFRDKTGNWPPYIPRKKADTKLDEMLQPKRFVLLTGRSKSGKSRTAFEAIRRNFQNRGYVMIVPARPGNPSHLPQVLKEYAEISKSFPNAILWLDDMERFLDSGVLSVNLINQTLERHKTLLIMGIMRSMEYARLCSANGEIDRSAQDTLDRAAQVVLEDLLDSEERNIGKELYKDLYPDLDFLISVGETFVAAKKLRDRFDHGPESNPGGFAIVKAAIDCRKIGINKPIPEIWLRKLFEKYLCEIEPLTPLSKLSDAEFQRGLEWATQPLERYIAMVRIDDGTNFQSGFTVHDYLIEHAGGSDPTLLRAVRNLVLERFREVGEDLVSVGFIAVMTGENEMARAMWEKGIELGYGGAAYNLGQLLRKERDVAGAKEAFETGLALGNGMAAGNLGVLLLEKGEVDDAKKALKKGVELGHGHAAYNLGVRLKEEGDVAGAKAAYETALRLGDGMAAINLSLLLREENKAEEAKAEEAKKALKTGVELGNGQAAFCLGVLLNEEGKVADAKEAFETGRALHDGQAAIELGLLLHKEGDVAHAKEAFGTAIDLGQGRAAFSLGILLEEEKDVVGAKAAYETGLALGDGKAAFNLGKLLHEEDNVAGAKVAFEKGLELGDGRSACGLGALLKKEGDVTGAKAAYQKGAELGDQECEARLRKME